MQWEGRCRLIGRAFAGEYIGLRPCPGKDGGMMEVCLGTLLIGTLHRDDFGGMRPAQYQRPAIPEKEASVTPVPEPASPV